MVNDGFEAIVAPYRRELEVHCYRMLGSLADAEDQVQETLLRAWRRIDGFEGRASVRAWLYKIATNGCIDLLRARTARTLPPELGGPADPTAPVPDGDGERWVDPCPPAWWQATPVSPEARFAARESVQLAFVVALQDLPATQRAALILRDVVGWSAAEAAELLDTSVAAVNSALQRARAALDARRSTPATPDDPTLLARYVDAWERGDLDSLVALLHQDVVASMPPMPLWLRGRADFATFMATRIGRYRLVPIDPRAASGDDATFGFYRRGPDGSYHAHSIQVVRVAGGLVTELHTFLIPGLLARFDLPPQLS
jgi:RNA polymerase sigma-70 factor, ECF subfamily